MFAANRRPYKRGGLLYLPWSCFLQTGALQEGDYCIPVCCKQGPYKRGTTVFPRSCLLQTGGLTRGGLLYSLGHVCCKQEALQEGDYCIPVVMLAAHRRPYKRGTTVFPRSCLLHTGGLTRGGLLYSCGHVCCKQGPYKRGTTVFPWSCLLQTGGLTRGGLLYSLGHVCCKQEVLQEGDYCIP